MGAPPAVDLRAELGPLQLANPVMTAAGTSGHGAELAAYLDLAELGAVVVKSLAATPWPGNPSPRVCGAPGGSMLNSVGLQGPGVEAWIADELPGLEACGATVIASIWGRRIEEFAKVAAALTDLSPRVVAVEVNVSCPNLDDRSELFAHSPDATAAALEAAAVCGLPLIAKLSPNTANLVEVAAAAYGAGAVAVTLVNTLLGLAIDVERRAPRLGGVRGGLSGPAIHPVALRAVYDVHAALPDRAIVGVGGVSRGLDAIELIMAGASAVQVGTATFADPRATRRVLAELTGWCVRHEIATIAELVGAAHD